MSKEIVKLGLTALALAGNRDNCFLGHFGCGMLASHFVCQEPRFPREGVDALQDCRRVLTSGEAAPVFEEGALDGEGSNPALVQLLRRHVLANIADLSRSGHVSIVAMYALRGLSAEPSLATPARIDGIIRLIDAYMKERPEPRYYGHPFEYGKLDPRGLPIYRDSDEAFEMAVSELREVYPDAEVEGVYYYFAGEKLHGLTHAHALYELECIGEMEMARRAYAAHRLQMLLNRMRPPAGVDEVQGIALNTPEDPEFWRIVPGLQQQLGVPHAIKRGYALLCGRRLGIQALADEEYFRKMSYLLQGW